MAIQEEWMLHWLEQSMEWLFVAMLKYLQKIIYGIIYWIIIKVNIIKIDSGVLVEGLLENLKVSNIKFKPP